MGGPTSQNTPTRHPRCGENRGRRIAVSAAGAIAFLAAAWMAADTVAGSELARTIDAHPTQLADPRSWIA
jgi:hypothetical protein